MANVSKCTDWQEITTAMLNQAKIEIKQCNGGTIGGNRFPGLASDILSTTTVAISFIVVTE